MDSGCTQCRWAHGATVPVADFHAWRGHGYGVVVTAAMHPQPRAPTSHAWAMLSVGRVGTPSWGLQTAHPTSAHIYRSVKLINDHTVMTLIGLSEQSLQYRRTNACSSRIPSQRRDACAEPAFECAMTFSGSAQVALLCNMTIGPAQALPEQRACTRWSRRVDCALLCKGCRNGCCTLQG